MKLLSNGHIPLSKSPEKPEPSSFGFDQLSVGTREEVEVGKERVKIEHFDRQS